MTIETYVFAVIFVAVCVAALLSILGWIRESDKLEREKRLNLYISKLNRDLIFEIAQMKAERNLMVATKYNEEGKTK